MRASRCVVTIGKQVLKLNHNLISVEVYNQSIKLVYKGVNNVITNGIRVISLSPLRCIKGKMAKKSGLLLVPQAFRA